jgi:hypothetical protein
LDYTFIIPRKDLTHLYTCTPRVEEYRLWKCKRSFLSFSDIGEHKILPNYKTLRKTRVMILELPFLPKKNTASGRHSTAVTPAKLSWILTQEPFKNLNILCACIWSICNCYGKWMTSVKMFVQYCHQVQILGNVHKYSWKHWLINIWHIGYWMNY